MNALANLINTAYYIFSLIYTFEVWGFGWGLLGIIFPVFPMIDLAKYLMTLL